MKSFVPVPLFLLICLSSCVQHKDLVNFSQVKSTTGQPDSIFNRLTLRIETDDLLQVEVNSINAEAVTPFQVDRKTGNNQQLIQQLGSQSPSNYPLELFNGYLVDRAGEINLPIVGKLKVDGFTLEQVEDTITSLVKTYLKDVVVNVRFLNLKITVLGEVTHPGLVRLSSQRMTLLEAIGNVGDFTPYANRTNVLLIREEKGKRVYQRLDFNSNNIFASPYFYLKQNDVLYVEPIKAKVATVSDNFQRGVSYGTAFLSVITLFVALFR